MPTKELRIARLLSKGVRNGKLRAIQHCMRAMDTPMTVRCQSLNAAIANEAYLDMMRRTHRQFIESPVIDSFHPEDRFSGQAQEWLKLVASFAQNGIGSSPARVWNGCDVIPVRFDCQLIAGWLVGVIRPCEAPQDDETVEAQKKIAASIEQLRSGNA